MGTHTKEGKIMPRKAREVSDNGIYYIYTRCLDNTYLCGDKADFEKLLCIIGETKAAMSFALYAFSITRNEIHMIVKEFSAGAISKIMKKICFDYTKYRNNQTGGAGKLFKDRFKSQPLPLDDNFLNVVKSVHQSPISAGMTMNISAYPFCSYHAYFDSENELVDCGGILHYFSTESEEALRKFKLFHAGFPDGDIKPKQRLVATRDEVAGIIKEIAKMEAFEIKTLEKSKRNALIKKIKKSSGLSIRQIAFATRLSRNTISEVLKAKTLKL